MLGAIDATWLDCFYEDLAPEITAKLKSATWQLWSLRFRVEFWTETNARMKRLDNRIGQEAKRIRMAVHARVPWPMEPERDLLKLLEAKLDFEGMRNIQNQTRKMIESNERMIKSAIQQNADLRQDAVREAQFVLQAGKRLEQLSKKP